MLYLVRHGETSWNADGRFQGQQDSPLSEIGRIQAQATATALAPLPLDAVFTSDLARAAETATAIAAPRALTPIPDARLREAHFGEWEGLTLDDVARCWPEALAAWRADSLNNRPPGGEGIAQVYQRVMSMTQEVLTRYPEGAVAIVGHGGSLRAIVVFVLEAALTVYRRIRLDNCSITSISVREDRFVLLSLNDTCHLRIDHLQEQTLRTRDPWRVPPPP